MKLNGLEIVNHHVAHIPMLFAFCKESDLIDEANAITKYVPGSSAFSPGFVASVMIVSIFSGVNPLYKMEYVWNQKVCDAFFGKGLVYSSTFNEW